MLCGLTGNIAMGKSTVAKTFTKHNIPVVDADLVAREVVEPGTIGLEQITNLFGKDYLNEDGTLNRLSLGNLVFSDKEALRQLNAIMGPLISERSKSLIQTCQYFSKIVVYNAALICEMGNARKYDPLIVVTCDKETQLQRLMARNSLSEEEALNRINAQLPIEEKIKVADYVINTNGSVEYSIQQTENIIAELKSKK